MNLTYEDFEKLLNFLFSEHTRKKINSFNISIEEVSKEELQQHIDHINNMIDKPNLVVAGSHRINDWNNGWNENNIEFNKSKDYTSLIPKYFNKYKNIRYKNKLYKTNSENCELNMLRVLQLYLYEKYCKNINNIYEFGCGTGHNLFALSEIDNEKSFFGFDWSNPPKQIFENIEKFYNRKFKFNNFDFVNPNYDVNILNNSVVFTFAALEQIGEKHIEFTKFLINKNPTLCIHLEPIAEILDQNDALQDLSVRYINKRNYLSNFYTSLKQLEKENKIEILEVGRSTIGSYLIEGYSIIVWRKK